MENNHRPQQKLGYIQLQETGRVNRVSRVSPLPLTCSPSQSMPVYLSDHTVVQDEEKQGRGSQEEGSSHLQGKTEGEGEAAHTCLTCGPSSQESDLWRD